MKIIDAKIISGDLYITFLSEDSPEKGDYFKLNTNNYFEVRNISISGDLLQVNAEETGYWANKLKVNDLRQLIGLNLAKVDSEEEIKRVREESRWT